MIKRDSKFVDLTGRTFHNLTILREAREYNCRSGVVWICKCVCGKEKHILGTHLTQNNGNHTKSCGCLRGAYTTANKQTHGMTKFPEYRVWDAIKQRCTNPNSSFYSLYGGRDITICDRWLKSFENFYEDMGPRPKDKDTIERKDNNRGYTPDNCIWADRTTQARNKNNNHYVEYGGITKTIAGWAENIHMNPATLLYRLTSGWSIARALTQPIRPRRKFFFVGTISV